jgi:hypothetical protein
MNTFQIEALSITVITFVLSFVLAFYMTRKYKKSRASSLLFWSAGMQAFAIGVFIEVVFALGIATVPLVSFYVFLVALIVELLALGSIQLIKSKKIKRAYYAFCIVSTVLLAGSVIAYPASISFVTNYVAWGALPLVVTLLSTLITIPASIVLLAVAIKSYLKTRNKKLLSIIAGVVFVVIAGTLFILSFPALLYISEFVGILLLWYGFYSG